mmetsp:Transcript_31243/g.38030  ORF Transcript_31243/g.38030 Transcript_31243/m.38030 type:complete len:121 (-) Transcript_31243:146-508(-)|eukprot:CAMPEP_0194390440 /NCGR_PEP_ID=MMETSP0174-20130528/110041_1 /TAXON_ID=216777 /ORGANISM="Proboscia alata, Strain PI-D3" /LENGTH=120 /DNA_ID=CAMNT_0039183809 /DNA_START=189 /DNA_END=551 /DNA_ORIENTATION=+
MTKPASNTINMETKTIVQTASIIDEEKMIEYIQHHDNIWPEVKSGLKKAGILNLHIYRVPNTLQLIMIIEVEYNLDLDQALGEGSDYRTCPIAQKWEEMMDDDFHGGWKRTDKIHSSDNW